MLIDKLPIILASNVHLTPKTVIRQCSTIRSSIFPLLLIFVTIVTFLFVIIVCCFFFFDFSYFCFVETA